MPGTRLCGRLTLDDFLCFDFNGPTGITVSPDGSRADFFHHMGLRQGSYRHQQLYEKMKREAVAGMERLFKSRNSLQPELIQDETISPPFSLTQISETAFQRQVEKIYESASSQTKGIYDLTRTDHEGNWVIRWMLWRVIQSRQKRLVRAMSSDGEAESSKISNESLAPRTPASMQTPVSSPAGIRPGSSGPESCESTDLDEAAPAKLYPPREAENLEAGLRSKYWVDVLGK